MAPPVCQLSIPPQPGFLLQMGSHTLKFHQTHKREHRTGSSKENEQLEAHSHQHHHDSSFLPGPWAQTARQQCCLVQVDTGSLLQKDSLCEEDVNGGARCAQACRTLSPTLLADELLPPDAGQNPAAPSSQDTYGKGDDGEPSEPTIQLQPCPSIQNMSLFNQPA